MKLNRKPVFALAAVAALASSLILGSSAQAATSPTRYISLSSSGTVKVVPDAVRINATVSVVLPTNKEALAAASTSANAARAAFTANGVVAKYIKTTSITVYPEYNYTQDKGSVLVGYRASESFDVTVVNAKNAGTVVDAVVAAGGDNFQLNGVAPFVLDNSKATEAARANAIKLAKAKAVSYAKLLGVKLGGVIYMEESSAPVSYPVPYMAMAKADSGATQVDLGQQDVTVSVNIRWYIS